jgi:hypothetical protein
VLLPSGKTVPLSPAFRQQLETKFGEMAVRPLRCLAFALKDGKDLGDLANFGEVQYLQSLELNNFKLSRRVLYAGPEQA